MILRPRIILSFILLVFFSTVGVNLFVHKRVAAAIVPVTPHVNENKNWIPNIVVNEFFTNPTCWNPAGNRYEGGANAGWLSPAIDSSILGEATVNGNADSVNLWLNAISMVCNNSQGLNLNGTVRGGTVIATKTTTVGHTVNKPGLSLVFNTNSSTLNNLCQIGENLRWVKICNADRTYNDWPVHQDLTLHGLASLGVGTHNIVITTTQRSINAFYNVGATFPDRKVGAVKPHQPLLILY